MSTSDKNSGDTSGKTIISLPLYYPYIHFRDEQWLKVAALYWPRMARIVSADYPTRDSIGTRKLADELGFVIDVDPTIAASAVQQPIRESMNELSSQQRQQFQVSRLLNQWPGRELLDSAEAPAPPIMFSDLSSGNNAGNIPGPDSGSGICLPLDSEEPQLAGVHASEIHPLLQEAFVAAGFAARGRNDQWLAMHRDLAWAYKCYLASEIARRNKLVLATDQIQAQAASSAEVTELFVGVSSRWPALTIDETKQKDFASAFGFLSLKMSVPQDLDSVPFEKIIRIRQDCGEEFDRWRSHVDGIGQELAHQLVGVESPKLLSNYLEEAVRETIHQPVKELRKGLRSFGVEVGEMALNSKFELPAGLAAIGLAAVNPQIAAGAGAALGVVSLGRQHRRQVQALRAQSPLTYLLDLQDTFTPESSVRRCVGALRRALGRGN